MLKSLKRLFWISSCIVCCSASTSAWAEDKPDLSALMDRLVQEGDKASSRLTREVSDLIEEDPTGSCEVILAKMKSAGNDEKTIAVCIWALGCTHSQRAAEAILEVIKGKDSVLIRSQAARALSSIGGGKAGEYIISLLDSTADKTLRFDILNQLARMKHAPALPKTIEILKEDWKGWYWHQIFIFGKMGDTCVPFLMEKLKDEDRNVRYNATRMLGEWLAAPEASELFRAMYFTEKDPEMRMAILASVERTTPGIDEMNEFFKKVVSENKEAAETRFAKESLGHLKMLELSLKMLKSEKKPDAEVFQKAYAKLWNSYGKSGNWQILMKSSALEDEPEMKKLRERILLRDSDEAFYDYKKANEVIYLNRLIKISRPPAPAEPPSEGETKGPKGAKAAAEMMKTPRGTVEFLGGALRRKNIADIKAVFCRVDRSHIPGDCESIETVVSFEITSERKLGDDVEILAASETEESKGFKKPFAFILRRDGDKWLICDYFGRGERRRWRNPQYNEDADGVKGGGKLKIEENECVILMPVLLHIGTSEEMIVAFQGKLLAETIIAKGKFMALDPVIPDELINRMPNNHKLCVNFIWLARNGKWKFPEDSKLSKEMKTVEKMTDDLKGLIDAFNKKLDLSVPANIRYISLVHLDEAKMFFGLVDAWNAFGGLWDPRESNLVRAFDVYYPVPEVDDSKLKFVAGLAAGMNTLTFDPLPKD